MRTPRRKLLFVFGVVAVVSLGSGLIMASMGPRAGQSATAVMLGVDLAFILWALREVLRGFASAEREAESEARLAAIVESSDDAIVSKSLDGTIRTWNAAAERIFGYRADEVIGKSVTLLLPPDRQHEETDILSRLRRGERIEHFETVRMTRDGRRIEVSETISPLRDHRGRIVGASKIARDITDLRREQQAVRERELRMRAIVDTAVDPIITIDERGTIESVNLAAQKTFGYAAEEMIGQNVRMLMPSPDREQHDQYLSNYRRTGHRKIIGIGREVIGQRKDGSTFPLDLAVSEVQLNSRRIFTGIIHDITERKQHEERLREARDAAERASKAKDHLLSVVSHELRTPLTPVLMVTSAMQDNPALPQEIREDIELVRRSAETEAKLIDDLLDLTRITRGKIHLHNEVVDTRATLKAALDTCRKELSEKRLAVSTHLDADRYHVWADPARLQQVFLNVIENAAKFTPGGGRVEVRTRNDDNGRIHIEITDSGIGIEPQTLRRIFNAFEQGETTVTRQFGGLGLGLTISKMLLDMQKATITASSEGKDKGATFTIEFDTVAMEVEAPAPAAPQLRIAPVAPLRILYVEDHPATRKVISMQLQRAGYEVRTAGSVHEALDVAAKETFDLLVSDIGLPDGSGIDIMRQVREHYGLKGIALSGFGMDEDVSNSKAAGFAQHLTKPVDFPTLQNVIQHIAC